MLRMEAEVGHAQFSTTYCLGMDEKSLGYDTPHSTLGETSLRPRSGIRWVVGPLMPLGLQLPPSSCLLSPAEMQ